MSVNILQRSTNTYTINSLAAKQTSYAREGSCNPFAKISLPDFDEREKYSSRSYWNATDIDNPQKKTQLTIRNYPIKHQGSNTLDIVLEYAYHYGVAIVNCPSTDLIYRQLNLLLLNYPNEEDFWEVMNCYLSERILRLNPLLSEVTIAIAVHANSEFPYHRSTTVKQTNQGSRQETWHFSFPLSFINPVAKSDLYKVDVDYTYDTNSWEFPYPDFMIIYKQLENLLASNWESKSWLKTQRKLIDLISKENSTLTSVSVELQPLVA